MGVKIFRILPKEETKRLLPPKPKKHVSLTKANLILGFSRVNENFSIINYHRTANLNKFPETLCHIRTEVVSWLA